MKRIVLSILLSISLITCFSQTIEDKSLYHPIYQNDTLKSDQKKFIFYYHEDSTESIKLDKIEIFLKESLIQTLEKEELYNEIDYIGNYNHEIIDDYNFDGIKDIAIKCDCGSGGCTYLVWLYSKKDNKYHLSKDLSGEIGLELDKKNKNIIFHYRAGWAQEIWSTFKFVNEQMNWVKELYQERSTLKNNRTQVKRTYSYLKNGKKITKITTEVLKNY